MLNEKSKARASEAKLNAIFNTAENLLMFTLNKKRRVTSYNQNFLNVIENVFTEEVNFSENFINKINTRISDESEIKSTPYFSRAFDGIAQDFEVPIINKDGAERWYQIFLNPISFNEKINEISCITYDITDRKESDNKIRSALKEKEILLQEVLIFLFFCQKFQLSEREALMSLFPH